ncbi:protein DETOXIFICATION 16 isoform X2 [Lathyrus oleraceus]|uniref:Protein DETOXIFICATION 16, variant 2 n=1 Tax=Pisum sativum TaxID=3888 RepID=A0A9D4YKY7_PEA|nr:protein DETOXIFICATION 16-like isoform X2 [Pisum sativum]KAI5441542.1 Protein DETOXIFICATION 16, variant 2 [Pisum sativum]
MSLDTPLIVEETKQNSKEEDKRELIEEVKKQLWLSGPLVSVSLLNFGIDLISVMFVGHLGELTLSGASMATSFATVTGFSLLAGMASALDTLCGQSYGAKQYRMLGVHTQRAMFILMMAAIPLAIIWANTRSILIFLGQDPEISTEAGNYAKLMVPGLFGYGLLQCLNRFLQTQNIVFPMLFGAVLTTLLHIPLCWIMVYKSGLGGRGAAIANLISEWLNVIILSLYIKFSPSCKNTWHGFSKEALALNNIPIFLKLAIPSTLMVCLEMWSFELMVLLSGLLPNSKLETSVLSICLNTEVAIWMIPFGLGEAISNEEEVVKYVGTLLPILAATHFLDGLQCVLSGMARGCGWQESGAYVNLGAYYLVGVPAAVVLAFVLHVGGKGLLLGMICAFIVQVFALTIITIRTDWKKEIRKASDRVNDSITTESLVY